MLLFSSQDLILLAKKNIGLRLTSNANEFKSGGTGDAIPLSHLAGANDIIEFVSLAFLPELPRKQMDAIYNRYKEADVSSCKCVPRLILHYAAQHDIGDARERLSHKIDNRMTEAYTESQLGYIDSEAKELAMFYNAVKVACPLDLVADRYPNLTQELTYNFNEKLRLRLRQNWNAYAINENMYYLFLTPNNLPGARDYDMGGYDFNHYPLGKVGRHNFAASNIVTQVKFSPAIDSEENLAQYIFELIKGILINELPPSFEQDEASWCDCTRCSVM